MKTKCSCGCGRTCGIGSSFISGHNLKLLKRTSSWNKKIGMAQKAAWDNVRKRMPVGSKRISHDGYVIVKFKKDNADGRAWRGEHLLVMEKMVGRKLRPGEQVHHIDGDRKNNLPENLFLCKNVSEHHSLEWSAKGIIKESMVRGIVKFDREKKRYILC